MDRQYPLSITRPGHNHKDPAITMDPQQRLWVAWQHYHDYQDHIQARGLSAAGPGPLLTISPTPGLNSRPAIACDSAGRVWVIWVAQDRDEWRILARPIISDQPGETENVAASPDLQYAPSACAHDGAIYAAWHAIRNRRHVIMGSILDGDRWAAPRLLSPELGEHYRPTLCATTNGVWLAHDTLTTGYAITLRRWHPDGLGDPLPLQQTAAWEMFPRLVADGNGGVWAAWIATQDVQDPRGIIDHKVDIRATHCALAADDSIHVHPYAGPDPSDPGYVAHCYDGLLGLNNYWGFLGRRRRPQLVRDDDGTIWLLYERKEDENRNAHGPDALLWATPLTGADQGRTFQLDQDAYAYTVDGNLPVRRGQLSYCAQIPFQPDYGDICAGMLDLTASAPVEPLPRAAWAAWQPTPPAAPPTEPRPQITVDGTTYYLYWGDTHCHGSFSGDAEGEIDENYAYGRYRAGIDFMAVTDNDFIYDDMLTPSAWAVLRAEAAHHNEPGQFVTFSGYERSYRDPAPDGEGTVPNHRIVLFPDDDGPLHRYTDPNADTLEKHIIEMEQTNAFVYAHHANWRILPSARLGGAEACSSWDIYMHISDAIPQAWREGFKLALIGSSDTHRIVPGRGGSLMGVWATELSREAIMDALWHRRCFATNGERLFLNVHVDGQPMGSVIPQVQTPFRVACEVTAPRTIVGIKWFCDGEYVGWQDGLGEDCLVGMWVDEADPGEHFYYVEIELEPLPREPIQGRGGNLQVAVGDYAWSSPIWVTVLPQEDTP